MRARISPRQAWIAFGAFTLIGFALWLLPLAILASVAGLGDTGLAARTVDGTAWKGRMLDASFKGARLGDLQVRVSPLDLLTGTARFRVSALSGEGMSGEGYAGLSGQGIRNVDARLVLGHDMRAVGVETAQLSGLSLRYKNGRCTEASGQMTVYLADGLLTRAVGPQMSGAAVCANGELSFRLSDPEAKGTLTLQFPATGQQRFIMILRPSDTLDKGALKALGFVETPVGYKLTGVIPS
jgi:general secretion pathway protein N